MAFSILSKPNVQAANAEFPFGNIRDKIDGTQEGTPVNTLVYGDFHQFFAKIMDLAGIAFNNIADNAYDGYQYVTALITIINNLIAAAEPKRASAIFGDDGYYGGTTTQCTLTAPSGGSGNYKIKGVFLCGATTYGTSRAHFKCKIGLLAGDIAESEFQIYSNTATQDVNGEITVYTEYYVAPGASVYFITEDLQTNSGVQMIYGSYATMEEIK
ncbi:MAG TPA: hypothetical protein VN922_19610 [Bacteroidia bacterium]|nr:hypothetical protein [Bacteroidia bacterium]